MCQSDRETFTVVHWSERERETHTETERDREGETEFSAKLENKL